MDLEQQTRQGTPWSREPAPIDLGAEGNAPSSESGPAWPDPAGATPVLETGREAWLRKRLGELKTEKAELLAQIADLQNECDALSEWRVPADAVPSVRGLI